jgi:hypothetical protein
MHKAHLYETTMQSQMVTVSGNAKVTLQCIYGSPLSNNTLTAYFFFIWDLLLSCSTMYVFSSCKEEIRSHCLHPPMHLGVHFIIVSKRFPFEVLLHWSTEMEIVSAKSGLNGKWTRHSCSQQGSCCWWHFGMYRAVCFFISWPTGP